MCERKQALEREVCIFRVMHPWEQRLVLGSRADLVWRMDIIYATQDLELLAARQGVRAELATEVLWDAANSVCGLPGPEHTDARAAVLDALAHLLAQPAKNEDVQFRNDVFVHEMLVVHQRCALDWRHARARGQVHLPSVRSRLQHIRTAEAHAALSEVLAAVFRVVFAHADPDPLHTNAAPVEEHSLFVPPGAGEYIASSQKLHSLCVPSHTMHGAVVAHFLRDVASLLLSHIPTHV